MGLLILCTVFSVIACFCYTITVFLARDLLTEELINWKMYQLTKWTAFFLLEGWFFASYRWVAG